MPMSQLTTRRACRQDGMALVLVLLVIAALTLLAIAGTRSAQTELQMGSKELYGRQALSAAEAGINHAYSLIKNNLANRMTFAGACTQCAFDNELSGSGTGGTLASIGSTATLGTQSYRFRVFGGGATDGYYVQAVDNYDETTGANNGALDRDTRIYLVSRGHVGTAERVVTALVSGSSLFPYGIFSKTTITMSGGSIMDSFDSRDGAYNAATAGSGANIRANGQITLTGGSTTVKGDATTSLSTMTAPPAPAGVTGTETFNAPALTPAPVPACGPPYSSGTGITPASVYNSGTGALNIQGGNTGTLAGGTYCFSTITMGGGGILSVSSSVNLYVTGEAKLSGGSISNTTLNASNLKLFSSYNAPGDVNGVTVSGGTQAYMAVYAPDTEVTLSGSTSSFYGSVIASGVIPQGGVKVHYDQSLAAVLGPGATLSAWHEVRN